MVFQKEFFKKVDFEKKSADNKKHEKFPRRQRVKSNTTYHYNSLHESCTSKKVNKLDSSGNFQQAGPLKESLLMLYPG